MVNTEIILIAFFAAEDGKALYNQQKQAGNWLWIKSWTPYWKIQTHIEESMKNHWTIQVRPKSKPLQLYSRSDK